MSRRKIKILLGSIAALLSVVLLSHVLGESLIDIFRYTAVTTCVKPVEPAVPSEPVTYISCNDAPPQMPTMTN